MRRIISEKALDVVLDRALAAEHRRRHFQVMTTITRNQRQVAAANPDDRANRVADAEDRQEDSAVPVQPGAATSPRRARPIRSRDASGRGRAATAGESRPGAGPRRTVGDRVEGRRDPAVPHVQPGAERRRGRREQAREASDRSIPASPLGSLSKWNGSRSERSADHGLVPLSIASRLARNSLSGFHSG